MKTILLIVVAMIIISCGSDIVEPPIDNNSMMIADDSSISDSLKKLYYDDAYRMALRHSIEVDSTQIDSVFISDEIAFDFYNGLIHIHNSFELSERDTVVEIFPIHTWLNPDLHVIDIITDSNATWVYKWIAGEYYTGYDELDSLMESYGLNITKVEYLGYFEEISYHVRLFSKYRVNAKALAKKFKNIKGVRFSDPQGFGGDGHDITADLEENSISYLFYLGWGDCPSGCTISRSWWFDVNFNGEVAFKGSSGASTDSYHPYP